MFTEALESLSEIVICHGIVRKDIPAAYLEKLLIEMRRAGLVRSFRGSQGGYQLARPANRISLGQILEAVGETIEPLSGYHPRDEQAEDWVTFTIWLINR